MLYSFLCVVIAVMRYSVKAMFWNAIYTRVHCPATQHTQTVPLALVFGTQKVLFPQNQKQTLKKRCGNVTG